MQEEEKYLQIVCFSDYVACYETLRKLMKDQSLADPSKMVPEDTSSSSHEYRLEQQRQVSASSLPLLKHSEATPSLIALKPSFARGRNILAMTEHLNSRHTKRYGPETHRSRPIAFPLLNGTDTSKPGLVSTRQTESSDYHQTKYLENSVANGDDSSKLELSGRRNSDYSHTKYLENTGITENPQWCRELTKTSNQKLPIKCMPAGMLICGKPSQRNQPAHRVTLQQLKTKTSKGIEKQSNPCKMIPPSRQSHTLVAPSQVVKKVNVSSSSTSERKTETNQGSNMSGFSALNLQQLFSTLKSARERSKDQKLLEQEPCSSKDDSNSVILKTAEDDMKELLKLARGSIDNAVEESTLKMLKLSRLADLIEEGRVLARSDFSYTPTHNLKDFPFDCLIHEALKNVGYEKPKTIQAYVWESILRGHHVAYVAGARTGKTLGYLVPILNNLIDRSEYSEVPAGCSPLVVIICSSWENAEMVNNYCCHLMKKVTDFRSAVFTDSTVRNLQVALPCLINGVTVLAATAPALSFLLEESKGVISFDRCCHLVFDDADVLLQEHGEATKKLFTCYQESVRRMSTNHFIQRQIIACAAHWTKGMEILSSKAMKSPSIFISSCMEAAIYGGMKLDVRLGTPQEMDSRLLEIMQEKLMSRTIIFCRGSTEVLKIEKMLSEIGITPLLAHNQSIVSDFDYLIRRWNNAKSGSAVLICTDDVLERIDIKNAQTLIHYFIPHHSKYDFSYRLSFAMDNFKLGSSEAEKPETHLLITKEFNNSLLTIVRFMQRFGHAVSDELATEAILSFCGKEARKKSLPLCETLKAFGFCRNMKFCGLRHVILESLDRPLVPRNGVVRIRITAVRTTNQYFARILKHRNEDGQLVDLTGSYYEVGSQLRQYFRTENEGLQPVRGIQVEVGNIYARRSTDELFERVRVETIIERDHQKHPVEVSVTCIDQGCIISSFVSELFELPDNLKSIPPAAVEIFLVGAKPMDRHTNWSRYSINFVREKLMSKELDGRVVLSLSSTLWLQPLHERKRLEGFKSTVVVGDILKELLTAQLAERNEEHIVKLHHLCETGGIVLPNYSVGLDSKVKSKPIEVAHAFLPANQETQVELVTAESLDRFYLTTVKFQKTLLCLEKDILKNISTCKSLTYEAAQVGTFCLAESPSEPGIWCRCCIKKKITVDDGWQYRVFFVDYGDYSTVQLNDLRTLPNQFISRLPFQAIACSLFGVAPKNSNNVWTEEDINFFMSLTRAPDGFMHKLHAEVKSKVTGVDEVTNGPHYQVYLKNRETGETTDIAQQMISGNFAVQMEDGDCDSTLRSSLLSKKQSEENNLKDISLKAKTTIEDEDEQKFDVSPDWLEFFYQCSETESHPISQPNATTSIDEASKPSDIETNVKPLVELEKSLTLFEYTLPLKDNSSRFPTTKWSQNKQDVFVTFFIEPVELYNLELTENHLTFSTEVNGLKYELSTSTYGYIIPEKSTHTIVSYGVKATLRKQEIGAMWTRFIHSPVKQFWLTRDFSNWSTQIDESDDENDRKEPIVDPKYAFEHEQTDSSSSDSDEECADERWMQDDD